MCVGSSPVDIDDIVLVPTELEEPGSPIKGCIDVCEVLLMLLEVVELPREVVCSVLLEVVEELDTTGS